MTEITTPPLAGLCPHCLGKGCDKCCLGEAKFGFGEGDWWTQKCTSDECGFQNGVRIDCLPGKPPSSWKEPYPCIRCKSPVKWLKLEVTSKQEATP